MNSMCLIELVILKFMEMRSYWRFDGVVAGVQGCFGLKYSLSPRQKACENEFYRLNSVYNYSHAP